MASRKHYYSGYRNSDALDEATFKLLEDNAETLINYIYDDENHQSLFGNPEVRIGLSIKIIHKLRPPLDETILRPILNDIEMLMGSREYLESTGDPDKRLKCLEEELQFVQRYIDFDDTITLNTEQIKPIKHTPRQQYQQKHHQMDETVCTIM